MCSKHTSKMMGSEERTKRNKPTKPNEPYKSIIGKHRLFCYT